MKQCSKCKELKSVSEFHKNKQTKDGFRPDCKDCCNKCHREYYQAHKVEKAKKMKRYQQNHKTKLADYDKEYQKTFIGYLHKRFVLINQRCNNPERSNYKYYGGRGVKCLFKDAGEFIGYVINVLRYNTYEEIKELQIDRIDNDGHYEAGNIRFTTAKINSNNRRKRK